MKASFHEAEEGEKVFHYDYTTEAAICHPSFLEIRCHHGKESQIAVFLRLTSMDGIGYNEPENARQSAKEEMTSYGACVRERDAGLRTKDKRKH